MCIEPNLSINICFVFLCRQGNLPQMWQITWMKLLALSQTQHYIKASLQLCQMIWCWSRSWKSSVKLFTKNWWSCQISTLPRRGLSGSGKQRCVYWIEIVLNWEVPLRSGSTVIVLFKIPPWTQCLTNNNGEYFFSILCLENAFLTVLCKICVASCT